MLAGILRVHEGLLTSSRVPVLSRRGHSLSLVEVAALLLVGAATAVLATSLDLHLRIPGHAIVRSVFPMAFGLALVPRGLAGTCMRAGALLTAGLLKAGGAGVGPGALASLSLTGPCLDLAILGARGGWWLYLRLALAGLACNLIALVVRFGTRVFEWNHERGLADWSRQAVLTYPLCGLVAGLVSAAVWFHLRQRRAPRERSP
jgi:hypothetical protein